MEFLLVVVFTAPIAFLALGDSIPGWLAAVLLVIAMAVAFFIIMLIKPRFYGLFRAYCIYCGNKKLRQCLEYDSDDATMYYRSLKCNEEFYPYQLKEHKKQRRKNKKGKVGKEYFSDNFS